MKHRFHRHLGALAFAGLLVAGSAPANAQTPAANTLPELFAELRACFGASRGSYGSDVTIVFSLRRDGSMIGRPKISHAQLPGDLAAQRHFVASIASALAKCLPVPITDALGGAIAGRPIAFRVFVGLQAALEQPDRRASRRIA